MAASAAARVLAALVMGSATHGARAEENKTGTKLLDEWEYQHLDIWLYTGDPPRCYSISPGTREAMGVMSNVTTSPQECAKHWQEEADLGNYDGYKDPKIGGHHSGGSMLGCSTWLAMEVDNSSKQVEGWVNFQKLKPKAKGESGSCDFYITIKGNASAFAKPTDGTAVKTLYAVASTPPKENGEAASPPIVPVAILVAVALIGSALCLMQRNGEARRVDSKVSNDDSTESAE